MMVGITLIVMASWLVASVAAAVLVARFLGYAGRLDGTVPPASPVDPRSAS